MWNLGVLAPHPVPYHAPLFRAMTRRPELEVTVYYLDRMGLTAYRDPELGVPVQWDIDLLSGYRHRFLRNLSPWRSTPLVRRVNPAVLEVTLRRRHDAFLFVGYSTLSHLAAFALAGMRGLPLLLKEEGDGQRLFRGWRGRARRWILRRLLRRFDGCLYSCRRNRAFFASLGVPPARLFPAPAAVDNDRLAAVDRRGCRRRVRARHGIPPDAVVVVSALRLVPRKRPADLVRAFLAAAAACPRLWLVLLGAGRLRGRLQRLLEDTPAGDRAVLTGFLNARETDAHMAAGDVFVLPSAYDPTPKALNEAMVLGLVPVVSEGCGTAGELVVHDRTGIVFPVGDVEGLAAHLRRLATDVSRRRSLAAAARREVARWHPDATAAAVVEALGAAAPRRRRETRRVVLPRT